VTKPHFPRSSLLRHNAAVATTARIDRSARSVSLRSSAEPRDYDQGRPRLPTGCRRALAEGFEAHISVVRGRALDRHGQVTAPCMAGSERCCANRAVERLSARLRPRDSEQNVATFCAESPTTTPRRPAVSRKRPNLFEVERTSAIPRLWITAARVACRPRWGVVFGDRAPPARSKKNAQHLTAFTKRQRSTVFKRTWKNACFL
jgi:hypothetical protein